MSKYKIISTEYRNLESLVAALHDLAIPHELAPLPCQPSLNLVGYQGDIRPELASLVIRREHVGSVSNDIGFAWDGKCYVAIVSEYDQGRSNSQALLDRIRQRYACREIHRQARLKGYTVQEHLKSDGTLHLTLTHR